MPRLLYRSILISSLALFEKKGFKICLCKKESVEENLVIDLTDNRQLSDEQASNFSKENFLVCEVFHPSLLEDFVAKEVYL